MEAIDEFIATLNPIVVVVAGIAIGMVLASILAARLRGSEFERRQERWIDDWKIKRGKQ